MFKHTAFVALLLTQWLNYPEPGVPRLPNGRVALSADAPRTASTREYMQKIGERKAGNPSGLCLPHGLPQADLMSYAPFKIVQTPTVIAVLYELDNNFRQIYTDGRSLPKDLNPTWGGYSVG